MKRWLVVLGGLLVAGVTWAAVTATPVFVQTPQLAALEIISGTARCTAAGQPFTCCTGSGTGSGCTTTAASTDAAPTWVTVYTGGANGSKITGLYLTSTDATAHVVTCSVNKNGARGGGVAITTSTTKPGFASAVPAINLLTATNWPGLPVDSDGNPYLYLSSASDKIDCRYATAITTSPAGLIGIVAIGADF